MENQFKSFQLAGRKVTICATVQPSEEQKQNNFSRIPFPSLFQENGMGFIIGRARRVGTTSIAKQFIHGLDQYGGIVDTPSQNLQIGVAVCNPADKFNSMRGASIAEGRAIKNPIITIPLHDLLNDDVIITITLTNVRNLIVSNPSKYLGFTPEKNKLAKKIKPRILPAAEAITNEC